MRPALALALFLVVALTGIAPSVFAEGDLDNYVMIKGGIYSPSKDINYQNVNYDTKTGFGMEIATGHYFLPIFATELGLGYFESKGSSATKSREVKVKVLPLLITAKGLLPMGVIEPYGELGIGAYFTKLEISGALVNDSPATKGVFGLHAGAGMNINILRNVFLGIEGRFLKVKQPSFADPGKVVKLDGFTVTADLGFRF